MITKIIMNEIKGTTGIQELTGKDIIVGDNGAGKTTRLQSLGTAILGYVPNEAKTNEETVKLATANEMTIGLECSDGFSFDRKFTKTIKFSPKTGKKVTTSQELNIAGQDGLLNKDLQLILASRFGDDETLYNFSKFLDKTDTQKREFIYKLVSLESGFTKQQIHDEITEGSGLATLKEIDKDRYDAMLVAIRYVLSFYDESKSIDTNLDMMETKIKAMITKHKEAKKDAEGAKNKLTEFKNELEETEYMINEHKAELEKLYNDKAQLTASIRSKQDKKKLIAYVVNDITMIENTLANKELARKEALTKLENHGKALRESAESLDKKIELIQAVVDSYEVELPALTEKSDALKMDIATITAKRSMKEELLKNIEAISDTSMCPYLGVRCENKIISMADEVKEEILILSDAENVARDAHLEIIIAVSTMKSTINEQKKHIQALNDTKALYEKQDADIENTKKDILTADEVIKENEDRLKSQKKQLNDMSEEGIDETEEIETLASLERMIVELNSKIRAQDEVRIMAMRLQESIIDSEQNVILLEVYSILADVVGIKGLRGTLVKNSLNGLKDTIQSILSDMEINHTFFFNTENDRGGQIFDFGWDDMTFQSLSTGEQMLLMSAIMVAFIHQSDVKEKILIIDNINDLDSHNRERLIKGLSNVKLDNIILAGAVDITEDTVHAFKVTKLQAE